MVHVHLYASGKYYKWKKKYDQYVADALSEMEAYWWNLSHLDIFWYPGAYQEFFNARYKWSHLFYTNFQGG